jgi:hypothetical protein
MDLDDLSELIGALLGLAELSFEALAGLARSKSWVANATPDLLEVVVAGHPLFLSSVKGRLVAVLTVLGLEDHVKSGPGYHPALRNEWKAMVAGIAQSLVGAPAIVSGPELPAFAHATWIGPNVGVGLDESDFDDAFPPALVLTCINRADLRSTEAISLRLGGTQSSVQTAPL